MLNVKHLSKSFNKIQAVEDVSFHVKKGQTFAFLGTNGAGKSTVIHMIIGLLQPDKGITQFAQDELIGVVFQSHRLDEEFTIEENIIMRAKLYGMKRNDARKRVEALLKFTNLYEKRDRLYGECSGGEKRKADIVRALIHQPNFLILDEPTTGLDANSREEIWSMLKQLQDEHALTIFLTTHYIEEAEHVDYVLIMNEGKIMVEGTPEQLRERYSKTRLHIQAKDRQNLNEMLQEQNYMFEVEEKEIIVLLNRSTEAIPLLNELEKDIDRFSLQEASLEDVYLQVTNQIKKEEKRCLH